jgi:hypothetical protein
VEVVAEVATNNNTKESGGSTFCQLAGHRKQQLPVSFLCSLSYSYDLAGRRASMGGSLAQTALPLPINEAEYNANNQLTEWGTASLYYDANGNMASDGVNSYVWNARNQLAS